MYARVRLEALVGLTLLCAPRLAWSDTLPEEEMDGMTETTVSVEITGLSRFPDHVFYVYPAYCTPELGRVRDYELHSMNDSHEGPDYIELQDGPLASWLGPRGECNGSTLYALARDIAAGVDLEAMTLEQLDKFFTEDPRLFASDFEFVDRPLYADRGSPLKKVHEVVRVLRFEDLGAIKAVVDSATYTFADDTVQTLKLGHTKRPPLPFRPLKPEKVAKYATVNAQWEARQPVEPVKAPRLPTADEEAPAVVEAAVEPAAPVVTPVPAPVATPVAAAAPALALATVDDVSPPAVPEPTRPEAPPPTAAAPGFDLLATRGWPLAAGFAGLVVVVGGVALARRRRG